MTATMWTMRHVEGNGVGRSFHCPLHKLMFRSFVHTNLCQKNRQISSLFSSPSPQNRLHCAHRQPRCWSLWSSVERKSRWRVKNRYYFHHWSTTLLASESHRQRLRLAAWEDCLKWSLRWCFLSCLWREWRSKVLAELRQLPHNCCSFLLLSPKPNAIVCDWRQQMTTTNSTKTISVTTLKLQ